MADLTAQQRDRWILWLPTALIAGSAAWMAAPADPPEWLGLALLVSGVAGAVAAAVTPGAGPAAAMGLRTLAGVCALAAAAGLGLAASQARSALVAAPAYAASAEPVRVDGWVMANDASDNGPRLRLLVREIEGQRMNLRCRRRGR